MGNRYDELDIKALQILMDYSNAHFPLDLHYLCEKLRIKLIPYSSLPKGKLEEINAIATNGELKDGCSIILGHPDENGYLAYTYYNDNIKDVMIQERIWFTISHEIKHGVTKHRHQNGACLPIDEFLAFLAQAAVDVLLCAHINFSFLS